MTSLTAVLLLSTLGATSTEGVLDPPVIDTLPEGLPPPQEVEGGVFLPEALAEALDKEREQGLACPNLCKALLLNQRELGEAKAKAALAEQEARQQAEHEKELTDAEASGFSLLEVIGIAGGTATITAIAVALAVVFGG